MVDRTRSSGLDVSKLQGTRKHLTTKSTRTNNTFKVDTSDLGVPPPPSACLARVLCDGNASLTWISSSTTYAMFPRNSFIFTADSSFSSNGGHFRPSTFAGTTLDKPILLYFSLRRLLCPCNHLQHVFTRSIPSQEGW